MKVITVKRPGDADQLFFLETPDPTPAPNQVLVHVAATALNRADILQREGKYPPPAGASEVLGLEMAGTVIEVGAEVRDLEVGDNVCALLAGGGYAQYAVVDEDLCLKLPERLSFTKAAAIPEAFLTAFQALHWIAGLKKGETVLIHAGASGVGTAALQLGKLAGATVICTASGHKHEHLKDLGADRCVDYRKEDFVAVAQEVSATGVDVVLDFVGGAYFNRNLDALGLDGRMVCLGALGGAGVGEASVGPILRKRLSITGTTLRNRPLDYKERLVADFRQRIWPYFADRTLVPVVDDIFDWTEIVEAHRYMESNANVGKIVVVIGE